MLKQLFIAFFCTFFLSTKIFSQSKLSYGSNTEVGKYVTLNGVKHYYEVYGNGKPLLLIHGNSTGIVGWSAQIEFFSKYFKVYAIDCRGRGKSDFGNDSLTYLQQAKDMAEFIRTLKLDSVNIIGKSDGGIIAIMMGIYYPQHIEKIVSFSANLEPDSSALYSESVEEIKSERVEAEQMISKGDTTKNWQLIRQRNRMMEFQPHVTAEELHKITVPVLVISTDRDVVKEDHTFFIYKNIPNANLSFIPGESHKVVRKKPEVFNAIVLKYLLESFKNNESRFQE